MGTSLIRNPRLSGQECLRHTAAFNVNCFLKEMTYLCEALLQMMWGYSEELMNGECVGFNPRGTEKVVLQGYSYELMNGECAGFNPRGTKKVFENFTQSVGGKRRVVVAAMGAEKSGKSTLLNTMFNLSFGVATSTSNPASYGNIMVLDTQGLATAVKSNIDLNWASDNKLTTFITTIADLTIINNASLGDTAMHRFLEALGCSS
ncbi:hypothetical protein Pelo_5692 [Pelomyxa schiedti]|nr:hypothetical protein Pelo_5692 [Pelomyxa schiedti]